MFVTIRYSNIYRSCFRYMHSKVWGNREYWSIIIWLKRMLCKTNIFTFLICNVWTHIRLSHKSAHSETTYDI